MKKVTLQLMSCIKKGLRRDFLKKPGFLILFLLMVPFAGWFSLVSAQEHYVNPFRGKGIVVVTDGSPASLAGLSVLMGVQEFSLRGIVVTRPAAGKSTEAFLKKVPKGVRIPSILTEEKSIPCGDSIILTCLAPLNSIPARLLAEKSWYRILVFGKADEEFQRPGKGGTASAVDVILPAGNLSLPPDGFLPADYRKNGIAGLWHRYAYKETNPAIQYELLAAYLLFPEVFDMKPSVSDPTLAKTVDYDTAMLRSMVAEILTGQYRPGEGVALAGFPTDPSLYKYDVRAMMDETIRKFGLDEWKACVLTDEIHGHLGIYSIVGAKMGIRARDYFHAGTDKLRVVTYGGSKPPKSCLNDGLQASTGATIGQGLITVASVEEALPQADFSYEGKTIRIRLKEEYKRQIENDISRGIVKYGLLNAGYWKMVRSQALDYWKNWDRNLIFEIIELPTQ